ncbi:MAG: hypothetical protein L3J71_06040 [Victivallaceae bacterium]|nr:hypothetical protein [Victivallaceae bacterium]
MKKLLMMIVILILTLQVVIALPIKPTIPQSPTVNHTATKTYYYVNNEIGNDSNAGSSSNPWETLQHAVDSLSPGSILSVVKTATPYKQVTISCSGTADNWIEIKGLNGEKPLLKSWGGFYFSGTASYICLQSFRIELTHDNEGIKIYNGANNLLVRWLEIDGMNGIGDKGILLNESYDISPGVTDCYFNSISITGFKHQGFFFFNPVKNITLNSVNASGNGLIGSGTWVDGFGGRTERDSTYDSENIYFYNCIAKDNTGDGFDIGTSKGVTVFENCSSHHNGDVQGQGYKTWSTETWFINCTAQENYYSAVSVKPLYLPLTQVHKTYLLNNSFASKDENGVITVKNESGGLTLCDGELYLYNNILSLNPNEVTGSWAAIVQIWGYNGSIAESDFNYYHANSPDMHAFRYRDGNLNVIDFDKISTVTTIEPNSIWRTVLNHNLIDPFVNMRWDLHIKSDSPAINNGTDLNDIGLVLDMDQVTRTGIYDIGADQY